MMKKSMSFTFYHQVAAFPFNNKKESSVLYEAAKRNAIVNTMLIPMNQLPDDIPSQIQVTISWRR